MASVNRRPQPSNSTPSKGSNPSSSPRPSSSSRQNSTGLTANGLGRSPSFRGPNGTSRPARANVKKPSLNTSFLDTNANVSDEASEDDARAENNALMEELRNRVKKAELASEEYQRQLGILQTRLNESMQEQGKLEDRVHESEARMNDLEDEKVLSMRQKRELEKLFESERTAMVQEKAEQKAREDEQQSVIQRLKEILGQRELRGNAEDERGLSRSCKSSHTPTSTDILSDNFQRASKADPPQTQRTDNLLRHLRCNAAILRTAPSSSCKRTDSLNLYALSSPKRRSK